MEKTLGIFVVKRQHFFNYFGLHLDLDFTFEKYFGLVLSFQKSGLVRIAKSNSPLISDLQSSTGSTISLSLDFLGAAQAKVPSETLLFSGIFSIPFR